MYNLNLPKVVNTSDGGVTLAAQNNVQAVANSQAWGSRWVVTTATENSTSLQAVSRQGIVHLGWLDSTGSHTEGLGPGAEEDGTLGRAPEAEGDEPPRDVFNKFPGTGICLKFLQGTPQRINSRPAGLEQRAQNHAGSLEAAMTEDEAQEQATRKGMVQRRPDGPKARKGQT